MTTIHVGEVEEAEAHNGSGQKRTRATLVGQEVPSLGFPSGIHLTGQVMNQRLNLRLTHDDKVTNSSIVDRTGRKEYNNES